MCGKSGYFEELKGSKQSACYVNELDNIWVYDDLESFSKEMKDMLKGYIE